MRTIVARLAIASLGAASIAGCTDDAGAEHASLGDVTITVTGAGSLSVRTWNVTTSCTLDEDAGVRSTTCAFPIEDDAAELVVVPIDLASGSAVTFVVSACGKPAEGDSVEERGAGIALRPRNVMLGVGCPSYPVHIEAKFGDAPPDDAGGDAGDDAADDAADDAPDATIDGTIDGTGDDAATTDTPAEAPG